MRLSSKGRYGVRALFDIAFHNDGGPTQVRLIARRQGIPPRFLEQIFQDLKKAGLVVSKRGPKGGYALAKPSEEIRVGDIVRALEGPVVLSSPDEGAKGDPHSRAVTDAALADLAERIEGCLDEMSVADLCQRGEAQGIRRKPPRRYVYAI